MPIKDVFPIKNGVFFHCHVSLLEGTIFHPPTDSRTTEEPVAGPPAWRFSVKLARVRAKPKETRRTTSFAVKTNKMVDDVALR